MLSVRNVYVNQCCTLYILYKEYSSALATSLWFYDECVILLVLLGVSPQLRSLGGEHPGQREEVVILWKLLSHFHEIPSQVVLPRQAEHSWKMIDLLVSTHFAQLFGLHCVISPEEIPVIAVRFLLIDLHS